MRPSPAGARGRLDGRRVLLTGAASGIGRATAARLLADGARVALVDLSWRADDPITASSAARAWVCDVSDPVAVSSVTAEVAGWLNGIDAVVHTAGIVRASDLDVEAVEQEDWEAVVAVNLTGAFVVARHVTPHLERSGGVLLLTGSGAGVSHGHHSVPYAASKGGLHGLAITLEESLRPRGVRVNAVLPGAVDTPLLRGHSGDASVEERLRSGRVIATQQVAAVMSFLVSEDASAVRGSVSTW